MKQTTWVYCPTCKNELTIDPSPFYHDDDGLVVYDCEECGTRSKWNFDAPVPLLVIVYKPL